MKFHTNRPVGADLFYADRMVDGQADMTKPTVAFRNCANTCKNCKAFITFSKKCHFYGIYFYRKFNTY